MAASKGGDLPLPDLRRQPVEQGGKQRPVENPFPFVLGPQLIQPPEDLVMFGPRGHLQLAVEQKLVLHYVLGGMFYVRKSNRRLHDDIYRGFVAAYDDGSYMALFRSDPVILAALQQADFKTRRVIEIDNPYLSPEVKTSDRRFWLRP